MVGKVGDEGVARTGKGAVAALALSMLLPSLGVSIANVGLPDLAQSFAAPFQQVQWVVIAYLLATTTTIVGAGRLGDLIGRRRLLLAGILLFTAASVLCGLAPSLELLVAARMAQGLGAAVLMALTMALVGEVVPKERTGSAMGLLGTMSAVGTAAGPSLGGVLVAGFGWRALFLAGVPLGIAAFAMAARSLPADSGAAKAGQGKPGQGGLDLAGMGLLGLTLAAYALAVTVGRGAFGPLNVALLGTALAGAGLFVLVEGRAASPLVRLDQFRDRTLSAGLATSALVSAVMMTTLVVAPFYLSGALGLGAATVGLAMAAGPLVSALTGVPAGRLVDRLGAAGMTVAGLCGVLAGCLALALLPASAGIAGYVVPLVVTTAGYATFQAANNTAVMAGAGPERRGLVSGLLNLSRNLGLITGASAMGAVFALASAGTGSPERGLHVTFAAAAGLILLALAVAILAGRRTVRGVAPAGQMSR